MAIQKKHGKGRLDKWYRLAKEKGYRARAAFKLIQLNKKYGFLEKTKVLLDLCAAPGSWCQVAAEVMPAQSLIIGVDLAPIKPIPRAITFQSDITTDKCRATIRQHVKHLKADTVLHDGAPNVGVAWIQDAFSQAALVLESLKLATEFLKEGGTFVTKVFRSKDYNALLWVFKQLFTYVEATKPPSSRNVSAEIFVVCRGYKAPKRIDPKFLDARHVFAEVQELTPNNEAKVFNPEKKKRKREGYEEGDYTQHKAIPVSEFIQTTDPIAILGSTNQLSFEQTGNGDVALATLDRLPETTPEIRKCCTDLKVLGRKEFRVLLRWRMKVRDIFGMSARAKKKEAEEAKAQAGEEVAEVESMDEEMKLQEELQRLKDVGTADKKRERRKENERKTRELLRMQLHMTTPHDIGLEQSGPLGEGAMFNIKSAQRTRDPDTLSKSQMEAIEGIDDSSDDDVAEEEDESSDDDEDRLDRELDSMYETYQQRREETDAKQRAKRARKAKETDEWGGLSADEDDREPSDNEEETNTANDLPLRQLPRSDGLSAKAAMFFDQDIFQNLGISDAVDDNDSAIEINDSPEDVEDDAPKSAGSKTKADDANAGKTFSEGGESDADSEDPQINAQNGGEPSRPADPLTSSGHFNIDIITAEAMTLAHSLATRKVTPTTLVDDTFNKYSFRDTQGLPDWFLDDESTHSKPLRPVTKEAADAIREKLRALNARPIKKVREAKGRKRLRAAQRLEKLKKKSALLVEDESGGMSEKDKADLIGRMMRKAARGTSGKKPKDKVKLVVARGTNRGLKGRPKGVKGRYKIVDARLKKDVQAEKRLGKKGKK